MGTANLVARVVGHKGWVQKSIYWARELQVGLKKGKMQEVEGNIPKELNLFK